MKPATFTPPHSRRHDVPVLHQDRADRVRAAERAKAAHEPVLGDHPPEERLADERRERDAGHLLQLRAVAADGQVHREAEVGS